MAETRGKAADPSHNAEWSEERERRKKIPVTFIYLKGNAAFCYALNLGKSNILILKKCEFSPFCMDTWKPSTFF